MLGHKSKVKCPVCGSTAASRNQTGSRCRKCGYENKKGRILDVPRRFGV